MKSLISCIPFLCFILTVQAQSNEYSNRMNHIFGAIDKTKVTTGYLKEFGIRFNSVESYNGILSDTNWVDNSQWQSLYNSLYSMRVGNVASAMTPPSSVFQHLKTQQTSNPDVVLLAALHYTYQQYKTTAYTNGDVTIVNERIYDVSGRNPYENKTAFAVTPMNHYLTGNTFSFKLSSNMLYTNNQYALNWVQVDFDNGQGYQTITLDNVISVTYTSGGEKEIKIKFVHSNDVPEYSHAKIYVDYVPSQVQARFSGSGAYSVFPAIVGAAYLGVSGTGDVIVETAGTDGKLDKPLIVVEGFDPDGSFNYSSLINSNRLGGINVVINASTGYTLNQAIEDEGYDLVFINFANGTDYIQRNAYFVEAVIEWVNQKKALNGSTEKNVVLGMSMGGLVARYALRHMETINKVHETKLYISHDAPHQGANVPLAYQAFVRHLAGESIGWPVFLGFFTIDVVDLPALAPALNDGLDLLKSPAAQQMLIYQLSGTGGNTTFASANSLQTTFINEFRNLGYPVQGGIRNIAISNGSECGTPLTFAPGATLANLDKTIDLPWFTTNIIFTIANAFSANPIRTLTSFLSTDTDIKAKFNLKALPNQQSQQIYKGRIYIKKKVLWLIDVEEPIIGEKTINSTSSMLPIDNSGGGVYDINQFIGGLPTSLSQFIKEQRFSFIPTYSSLDIGNGAQPIIYNDLARVYSPLAPPLSPKNTPFHNFFTNPTISERHIQFTLNNGNWLLTELKGTTAFYSCASSCSSLPELSITGPSFICTNSSSNTLSNLGQGIAVTWTASPSNLFSISSGTGINANLVAASSSVSGSGTLTYTISNSCGTPTQISKPVWVGTPTITFIEKFCVGTEAIFRFSAPAISGATYHWSINNPNLGVSYNGRYCEVGGAPNMSSQSYTLTLTITQGSCTLTRTQNRVYSMCGGGGGGGGPLRVFPNPASDEITVEYIPEETESQQSIRVELINQSLTKVYSIETTETYITIPVNRLPKGVYFLHVTNREGIIKRNIFIGH
jgi:hypothetical protein